jgi:hypothetical protein
MEDYLSVQAQRVGPGGNNPGTAASVRPDPGLSALLDTAQAVVSSAQKLQNRHQNH